MWILFLLVAQAYAASVNTTEVNEEAGGEAAMIVVGSVVGVILLLYVCSCCFDRRFDN